MRYRYASAKTREKAEAILEDCFAEGEISVGEAPRVEPIKDHRGRIIRYDLTLSDGWH
jgi:hypothetical protein